MERLALFPYPWGGVCERLGAFGCLFVLVGTRVGLGGIGFVHVVVVFSLNIGELGEREDDDEDQDKHCDGGVWDVESLAASIRA